MAGDSFHRYRNSSSLAVATARPAFRLAQLIADVRRIEEVFVIIHAQTRRPAEVPIARVLERQRMVIERQARHLTRLVEDLLDVSRSSEATHEAAEFADA